MLNSNGHTNSDAEKVAIPNGRADTSSVQDANLDINLDQETSTILVVDDEAAIADLVVEILEQEGYVAQAAYNGFSALNKAHELKPDLYILDIMMPGQDGMELLQELRTFSLAPVLFLSAKDTEADKVIAFTLGADDYIEKPFKKRELVARVEAHLRRANSYQNASSSNSIKCGDIELLSERHEAFYQGQKLALTPKEFGMLRMLIEAQGKPVSTDDLYAHVWQEKPDDFSQNTIMVHVRNIRKKIQNIAKDADPIRTVWGIGYKIEQ